MTTKTNNAVQTLQHYQNIKTKINNALDESGIGHDWQDRFRSSQEIVSKFCAELQAKITGQLIYDLTNNVPSGISQRGDAMYHANNAIRIGTKSAIGAFVHWDINDALEFAADIAEDVNAHPEAKTIRAMIQND